ncbi:MAG: hypothetical protein M0P69_17495 [Bacteroidales bacterium]|nr:hypothetical protein [Bacteroidales bacterium]
MRTNNRMNTDYNHAHERDIELQYSLSESTYYFTELVKAVSADIQKLVRMPLSKANKEGAIKEMFKIIAANMPE